MFKRSKEKSAEILRLFEEGVILTKICEITTSSQPTVKKVLRSLGIDYDLWAKEDYEKRLSQIPGLYEQGIAKIAIANQLRLTPRTVYDVLKQFGVKSKTKSEQTRIRWGNSLNENCFDELTDNTLYWIGFLYTDGHVRDIDKETSIELLIHLQDINHLEKYKIFLGCDKKVEITNRSTNEKSCRLRIYSKHIQERLISLGFDNVKSYSAVPHPSVKNSRDFWRGVVDGDGGVYNREDTPSLFLCGTLETIFEFIIFNTKHAKIKDKYPTKCKVAKALYQVHYYGQDAIKIATVLYEGSETYLDRKYQKFLDIKQREILN